MFNNDFITNAMYSDSMLNFLVNRGQRRTICGKKETDAILSAASHICSASQRSSYKSLGGIQ